MRTPTLHGTYGRRVDRSLDRLPSEVRALSPDAVFIDSNFVQLRWHGDVMTTFFLVVLSDDHDPRAVDGANWKQQAPRVWTCAD